MSARAATAHATARALAAAYDAWDRDWRWATRRAGARFAARDWAGGEADAARRLALWYRWLEAGLADARRYLGACRADRAIWRAVRDAYAAEVAPRGDVEVAESFFNSLARRAVPTLGLVPELHFVHTHLHEPGAGEIAAVARALPVADGPLAVARAVLDVWRGPTPLGAPIEHFRAAERPARLGACWADHERDVQRVARALEAEAARALGGWPAAGEIVCEPFFRGHGAFLVGRLERAGRRCPLVVALRHPAEGVTADAVLCQEDEASIVFGFSWSYFHVETPRPRALVAFLASVLPRKRVDELYTAIGHHRHAKTELFRTLRGHLARRRARFERAEGARGLVMEVFTLPSLEVVFKIIKDRFGAPKRTTRREVMERYHFVFVRDRVGRLADAQEFEGLLFKRRTFPDALLAELEALAPSAVRVRGEQVQLTHCYTERRLVPLDVYVRTMPPDAAAAAILDYGQAIRDLAVAGIFAGDLLLKNFGVSRHGRVIFYDYDELTTLGECRFRALPDLGDDEDWSGEPTYGVGEADVFPEEFARFAVPTGPLRDAFMAHHADLLDPAWWVATQDALAGGELVETFAYPQERRLGAIG